jgi:hypothetical protein
LGTAGKDEGSLELLEGEGGGGEREWGGLGGQTGPEPEKLQAWDGSDEI